MTMNSGDQENAAFPARKPAASWIVVVSVLVGLGGLGYGFYSHSQTTRILNSQKSDQRGIADMQAQVQTLQNRLTEQEDRGRELTAALAAAEQAAIESKAAKPAPVASVQRTVAPPSQKKRTPTPQRTVEDPRVSQLEKRISEQDEKLASTEKLVETARNDLNGRIDSTSRELNGSIARTAEEVAALRRRGERDYFEFDILKSKQAQRVGPVSVALRKSDVKKKRYNLDLMVDDNKLEKKNVNLLEPVYIALPEWPQPLELVVNQVTKDRVAGYISVPKFKRPELAQTTPEQSRLTTREAVRVQD